MRIGSFTIYSIKSNDVSHSDSVHVHFGMNLLEPEENSTVH